MAKLYIVAELTAKGHKTIHTYTSDTNNKTKQDAVQYVEAIKKGLLAPFEMRGTSSHCDINLQTDNMWVRRINYSNGVTLLTNATLI